MIIPDDGATRQQLDHIFATEESDPSEEPIEDYQELQNYQRLPSKPPVHKPIEGFQVPLIAEQDPKKLFIFSQTSPVIKASDDYPRPLNYYPQSKTLINLNDDFEDIHKREPNYIPNFNWEPVQVNRKVNNYIPNQLKIYSGCKSLIFSHKIIR